MKFFSILTLLMGLMLVASGCHKQAIAPEKATAPAPAPAPTPAPAPAPAPAPETKTPSGGIAKITPPSTEKVVPGIPFNDIHFDFDKYDIKSADKDTLKKLANWLSENPENKVRIEGNCDARGTREYNIALGDRRAGAARDYLVALGINTSRIETISYGKDKPLCTEATESCYARNRRDHFVILIGTAPK